MNRKKTLVFCAAGFLVVLCAAWLWYARPLTMEKLYPEVGLEDCVEISITGNNQGGAFAIDYKVELSLDDPEFAEMMALLEGRTYRRSPMRQLFDRFTRTHLWEDGDYWWRMRLGFEDETGMQRSLYLDNWFGQLSWVSGGYYCPVSTAEEEQLFQAVMEALLRWAE